ncbi:hypothetical protein RMATCC62417_11054 [Rhizopus microsporus]|nr:hypothetical protein RMATCC62417_11054 [Rhizopus microsporus]
MSSVFDSNQQQQQQQQQQSPKQPEQTRPKRPRSSLACIRCRKKKVKCDFVQPTCGRCAIAGLPCSYATPPRRVDGHAFDQLGNHVEELKERMERMRDELDRMKININSYASSVTTTTSTKTMEDNNTMQLTGHGDITNSNQSVTWKLSLSPSGLRIDTNIASVADLYKILLNGISQLNINNDSNSTSLFNPETSVYSSSSSRRHQQQQQQQQTKRNVFSADSNANEPGRLWEVDDTEAKKILQEKKLIEENQQQAMSTTLPKDVLDNLMHSRYHSCFLAYEIVDKESFMQQYTNDTLDPLLKHSIDAWVSKHGCIYHSVTTAAPSNMGEVYFKNARQLLKKCFDISSPTTIHALLNLYMYQLSSERSSLAYLYIGLAIRMAQDLKFHKKEHMSADLNQRETNKRLWWSAYWLDLCAALESNRPTMVDDKDCDLDYPVRLDHEDEETGYRIHFTVYSIKLMRIRKDITKHLPSEQSGQSLLSAISRLENVLTNWLSELPQELHFTDESSFQKTNSFRDEACLILNIQYQTTWIMLHKFFLPKQDQTATPVALLSLNICTKSANLITRMLALYANNLKWCQFFYAMDGIIASVTIHQANALSNEKEVSYLAQRNLIITANVLRDSPLTYMVKVCDIIESIEAFLKKNSLYTNLKDLPHVNEDSINQQSISSVFNPAVFESPQPSTTTHTTTSTNSGNTTLHTNNNNATNTTQPMFDNLRLQPSQPLYTATPTPPPTSINSTASPIQAKHQSPMPHHPHHQQQQQTINFHNPDSLIGVEANLIFTNENLMGFGMSSPQSNTGNHNTGMLLGGIDFNMPASTSTTTTNTTATATPPTVVSSSSTPATRNQESLYIFGSRTDASSPAGFGSVNYSFTSGHQSQQYPQQFLSNSELFTMHQPSIYTNPQTSFDPHGLFDPINMDMNTFLYETSTFNPTAAAFPPQNDNDLMYPGGKKRTHRDWEDTA